VWRPNRGGDVGAPAAAEEVIVSNGSSSVRRQDAPSDEERRAGLSGISPWLRKIGGGAWLWLGILLVAGIALTIVVELAIVVVPVILGLILATIAAPPTRWLERRGLPSALATTIVVIGGLFALLGGLGALVPLFITQAQDLGPTVVQGWNDLLTWAEEGPLGIERGQIEGWVDDGLAAIGDQAGELAGQAAAVATSTIEAVTAFILTIIITFFFVKDGLRVAGWIRERVPAHRRDDITAFGKRGWESLGGYVRGTATVALIDAVGIGLGLWILGVPLVLPLAVLVFFGGFIPIVGAALTGFLAVLVALASEGLVTALIVLAIVALVQQIESDILQPMIMGRVVPLHPLVVLLVLSAGAKLIGLIGALLAVPLAASVSAIGNEVRLRSEHPGEPGPEPLGGPDGQLEAEDDDQHEDDQHEDDEQDAGDRG
jgi:putative heme transporter